MLIGNERTYYHGLVGNSMQVRCLCPMVIYVSQSAPFEISTDGRSWETRHIIALAPFTKHRVKSSSNLISMICIEPETVDPVDLMRLISLINAPAAGKLFWQSIHVAHNELAYQSDAHGFSTAEFDHSFLGEKLLRRTMDARIVKVLEDLCTGSDGQLPSADECAMETKLSTSRFLHLFKDSTSVSFRSYRMWRRARRFLDRVNGQDSLTDVALDLGYPDSSHFSNSIRQIYGLQPRLIRDGSQHLRVHVGSGYQPSMPLFV